MCVDESQGQKEKETERESDARKEGEEGGKTSILISFLTVPVTHVTHVKPLIRETGLSHKSKPKSLTFKNLPGLFCSSAQPDVLSSDQFSWKSHVILGQNSVTHRLLQ